MVMIKSPMDRAICQTGTVVTAILATIITGEVSGKRLRITNKGELGADAIVALKKSGIKRGKITKKVAWLPSLGLGTNAPSPDIKLLYRP